MLSGVTEFSPRMDQLEGEGECAAGTDDDGDNYP